MADPAAAAVVARHGLTLPDFTEAEADAAPRWEPDACPICGADCLPA